MILVRSERAFNKNSHYVDPSQLICFVDQWNVFYTRQVFTEWYFQTGFSSILS